MYVTDTFDNWSEKRKLTFINGKHQTQIALKAGSYEFKFIVDGKWRHDPCLEKISDGHGGYNNTIVVAENLDNYTSYAASAVHSEIHHNDNKLTLPKEKIGISEDEVVSLGLFADFLHNRRIDYEEFMKYFSNCLYIIRN